MIPKLYQVKEFPLNDNGKVDRRKLLEHIKDTKKNIVKPKNDLEKDILKIVSNISNNKKISITDDFFLDLNFDSLDIMQMATMLNKYGISIQDINDNSTIETLSNAIEQKGVADTNKNVFQNVSIINKEIDFDLTNVLLTGATGFLGIHILRELIKNKNTKKVYCLIREKNNIKPEERMQNSINYYFIDEDKKNIDKIKVVEGDFELEKLGLEESLFNKLTNTVTTIIHCGANVSHYGKKEKFYKTNVDGTKNIIDFAHQCNAKLAHISTLSVGGYSQIEDIKILDENIININQDFRNHIYMITKYQAECEILKSINNGLEAKIFRLGNIMPRIEDGLFQTNKMDNGFLCRLKTILDTNSITTDYKKIQIDISPVDLCAKAIVLLLTHKNAQTIYHINNNNLISVNEIINNYNIKEVSTIEQIEKIKSINNPYNGHLLNDLLNIDFIETRVNNQITIKNLTKYGFRWNKIDSKYLKNIFEIIKGENNEKYKI